MGAAALFILTALSFFSEYKGDVGRGDGYEESLSAIICTLDGIDSAKCAFTYSNGAVVGVAVVYAGSGDYTTLGKIYELVSTLYNLPYNRIYISAQS